MRHGAQEGGARVVAGFIARQRGGQVKTKAVHMHLLHPVAQAVHHQAQRGRAAGVEGVAGAGIVHAKTAVGRVEPVVGGVVDAAQAQRGAEVAAFGRVVVDHVEDHFQPGAVQGANHGFELGHGTICTTGAVTRLGRKEARGVVAPVVDQAEVHQTLVIDKCVHRQQLDGCHTETLQMRNGGVAAQACIGATYFGGHVGMLLGKALDVDFVEHHLIQRYAGGLVITPVELVIFHTAFGHVGSVVKGVRRVGDVQDIGLSTTHRITHHIPQLPCVALHPCVDGFGIRVHQQLRAVAACARFRLVRAVHPVAVQGARRTRGQVDVPDVVSALLHHMARHFAFTKAVKNAEGHLRGHTRIQREVGARTVPCRAQRIRASCAGHSGGVGAGWHDLFNVQRPGLKTARRPGAGR